jgi:hypothetical protein
MKKILILFFVLLIFNLVFNLKEVVGSSENINVGVQVVSDNSSYNFQKSGNTENTVAEGNNNNVGELSTTKVNLFQELKQGFEDQLVSLKFENNNLMIFVFIFGVIFIVVLISILISVINHYKKSREKKLKKLKRIKVKRAFHNRKDYI